MRLNWRATLPHFEAHLQPILDALPELMVGERLVHRPRGNARFEPLLTASWGDMRFMASQPIIYVEHGAGQAYLGDAKARQHGSYSGGAEWHRHYNVLGYIAPSKTVADRWHKPAAAVGCPKMDRWIHLQGPVPWTHSRTVAITFHWDLVPEGQLISGPVPSGASVRRYEGPVVDVITRGGDGISVSPDHPVLTGRGWVLARELVEGDHMVRGASLKRFDASMAADDDLPPTSVENLAGSLFEAFGVEPDVMPSATPDFNRERVHEEINVVGADGFLALDVLSAAINKKVDHPLFDGARLSHVEFAGGRSAAKLEPAGDHAATSHMVRQVPQRHVLVGKDPVGSGLPDAEVLGKRYAGLPVEVPLDEIVDIRWREYSGHGYDFTTFPGWYEVNGFIVHNCFICPETRTARPFYAEALPTVVQRFRAQGWKVLGHGHPRDDHAKKRWEAMGVEWAATDADVFQRASLLIADNTSLMYEFASLGRPVLALNAPWYRKDVEHGLRFWSHVPGMQIDTPERLWDLDLDAYVASPEVEMLRERAVTEAYASVDGHAAARAASFIVDLMEGYGSL